jgi:MoxR-like ATPase
MTAIKSSVQAELEAILMGQKGKGEGKVEPVKAEDLVVTKLEVVPTVGKVEFEDIIGKPHPSGKHFFTVHDRTSFPSECQDLIPKVNPKFTEFDLDYALAVLMAIEYDKPMLAYGPPGTGKSATPEQICARINYPYMFIQGMGGTEPSDYVGSPWVSEGSMSWKDGPMSWAAQRPVFLLYDEPFKSSAQTNMCMQSLLDDRRTLKLYGHPDPVGKGNLKAHKGFRIGLADNVRGVGDGMDKYAAEIQDQSTLNRCKIKVKVDYPQQKTEETIIKAHCPTLPDALVTKMIQVASKIRAGWKKGEISMPFTLRDTQEWAEQAVMFGSHELAFKMSYLNGIDGEDDTGSAEVKAIKDVFKLVGLGI